MLFASPPLSFQVLNSLIMPYFPGEVKTAIMSTPAGTRTILDAAMAGLLQVLTLNLTCSQRKRRAANTVQDGDEGIKSQSLELILKLCSVDPGASRPPCPP
jgi:hypothetical protein